MNTRFIRTFGLLVAQAVVLVTMMLIAWRVIVPFEDVPLYREVIGWLIVQGACVIWHLFAKRIESEYENTRQE